MPRDPKTLDLFELKMAAVLLDIIVRPGDHDFQPAIESAHELLGYATQAEPRKRRGRKPHVHPL
jgi:hypothetical protein